eukprot:gb/GECH01003338.1/.p1 GENE.gb/GECH01003338.1/~~gb/GECH01003338.1/.p1  ORF type:complete len:540 (+),score=137.37 gb/GECH01003338.1/:1-1620(+)
MDFQQGSLSSMLKDGSRYLSGVDETTLRNIDAITKLSQITRTSMGPNGLNKIVINHLDKLFVTHDSSTIIKELEVVHPAAKMVVMASQAQEKEVGDGTNYVVIFAGELMTEAENLLRMGLHTSNIIEGYNKALEFTLNELSKLTVKTVSDVTDKDAVTEAIKATVAAKQYGYEDVLAPLIAEACINVCPKNPANFNVDNVRVCQIEGLSLEQSQLLRGMVLPRDTSGTIKKINDAKVAVFGCSVDTPDTETKGTVLIESADQLVEYNKSEEAAMEEIIRGLHDAGVNVVVSGGSFGELALHFLERYGMMAVKVPSKFDQRRLCRAVGARPAVRMGVPSQEKLGNCDEVVVEEIGDRHVTVFRRDRDNTHISTLVVRGATSNIMEAVERSIDDGVNAFKSLAHDGRLVAGAGATEIELASRLTAYAESAPGLDQYAIRKFASAFEVIPRVLAESAGQDATSVISNLYASHKNGEENTGVDLFSSKPVDSTAEGIFDPYSVKYWAVKLATDAVVNVLRVDQIIMSKPAGGPPVRQPGPRDM